MPRILPALLVTLALPVSLGLAGPPDLPSMEAPAPYHGPALDIDLVAMETAPPQYSVTVQGKMPGPGYTLRILDKVFDEKNKTMQVFVSLKEHKMKAPEGASTAAGDVLKASLYLGRTVGGEIRVLVQEDSDLPAPDHGGPPFLLAKAFKITG